MEGNIKEHVYTVASGEQQFIINSNYFDYSMKIDSCNQRSIPEIEVMEHWPL